MSFESRELEFRISLAKGATGELTGETVTLSGYRATVSIEQYGGASMGHVQAAIYGLPLDLIKRLTTIGTIATQIRAKNTIEILAGDEKNGLSTIFIGVIYIAWANFSQLPAAPLQIEAFSALDVATEAATATSFSGDVAVANIMKVLAQKGGLTLVNSGVTGSLSDPAFNGSARDQIMKCAEAAGINQSIWLKKLYIWPQGSYLTIDPVVVSPSDGLVGYPSFSSQFVMVDCEFAPTLTVGGRLTVEDSQLGSMVDGTWVCIVVQHELASQQPGGKWFTHAEMTYRVA